jgi:hypothetical protein
MSRAALAILIFVIRLACTPPVMAVDPGTAADSCQAIPEALRAYYDKGPASERLAYGIDLWYDAVLKGDEVNGRKYEAKIDEFLQQDLSTDEQFVDAVTRLAVAELYPNSGLADSSVKALFGETCELLHCKQALVKAWNRSESMSNKYRLLGDYIQLLRRELGLPKLRLAAVFKGSGGQTPHGGARTN